MDYDETFAPTARAETIQIMLAIAGAEDFDLVQFNIKTTYLNAIFNYFWTIQPILDFTTLRDLLMKSSYLYRHFHICIDILHFS